MARQKLNAKEQAMFDRLSRLSPEELEKELITPIPFDPERNTGLVMLRLYEAGVVKTLKDEG